LQTDITDTFLQTDIRPQGAVVLQTGITPMALAS
jgi:hypothetical protein